MGLSAYAAGWFLIAALPISIFVAFSDMARMKIPNVAVIALVISYAILGLIALPFSDYLWNWTHLVVVLVIGIALNAIGAVGAGDAKFAAAAAPFVPLADLSNILILFAICLLAGYVTHRIAKMSPLRKMVPHWESWETGKRFPMGFPLAMTLVFYLALVLINR
jgi:prepilin peptidase CpaA